MAATDLITRQELLDALNKVEADLEPQEIRKYDDAIRDASQAIRAYTNRDFEVADDPALPTTKRFEWDDTGYIEIDDAQLITDVAVNFAGGNVVTVAAPGYQAQPYNGPVVNTIKLLPSPALGGSPEMGFTYNLDTYEGAYYGPPPEVDVTAVWGWEQIPDDVQRAAIWTAAAFSEEARQVTSESIDTFSRSMKVTEASAIPLRSRELLDQYRRLLA